MSRCSDFLSHLSSSLTVLLSRQRRAFLQHGRYRPCRPDAISIYFYSADTSRTEKIIWVRTHLYPMWGQIHIGFIRIRDVERDWFQVPWSLGWEGQVATTFQCTGCAKKYRHKSMSFKVADSESAPFSRKFSDKKSRVGGWRTARTWAAVLGAVATLDAWWKILAGGESFYPWKTMVSSSKLSILVLWHVRLAMLLAG